MLTPLVIQVRHPVRPTPINLPRAARQRRGPRLGALHLDARRRPHHGRCLWVGPGRLPAGAAFQGAKHDASDWAACWKDALAAGEADKRDGGRMTWPG